MMKNNKKCHAQKVYESIKYHFYYELAPMTRDLTYSKF